MKKSVLIAIFIALLLSLLSLFCISIKPALSLYREVYNHLEIYSFYSYGSPLPGSHISSFDKLKGEITNAILSYLPEPPPYLEHIIIRESGIERNFTAPQEKKSPKTNPSEQ